MTWFVLRKGIIFRREVFRVEIPEDYIENWMKNSNVPSDKLSSMEKYTNGLPVKITWYSAEERIALDFLEKINDAVVLPNGNRVQSKVERWDDGDPGPLSGIGGRQLIIGNKVVWKVYEWIA